MNAPTTERLFDHENDLRVDPAFDPARFEIGSIVGRLMLVAGPIRHKAGKVTVRLHWECRCVCGTQKLVSESSLRLGTTRSCGCLARDVRARTHRTHGHTIGHLPSGEYRVWASMIQRCTNPARRCFPRYGGRGIVVCADWLGSFERFLADVGPRPSPRHEIDRIDNDGNYEPGNVRWATRSEQMCNTSCNRNFTIGGVTRTQVEWCRIHGVNLGTFRSRVRSGMAPELALQPGKLPSPQLRMLTLHGEEKPLAAWARELGLRVSTIQMRLQRGWPAERALTEKVPEGPHWRRREVAR